MYDGANRGELSCRDLRDPCCQLQLYTGDAQLTMMATTGGRSG
jgi:hypothetical protein